MKLLLDKIKYEEFQWNVCGELKVIAVLGGLQLGYTKYCCFLCKWDSRDRKNYYVQKEWPNGTALTPGNKNVVNTPLVDSEKVYLPPLHIKLGLMKNFMKAMDQSGLGFAYLKNKFSEAKLKEGPQIKDLFKDDNFDSMLNEVEKAAHKSFKSICQNFLGIHKSENYKEIVDDLLKSYKSWDATCR